MNDVKASALLWSRFRSLASAPCEVDFFSQSFASTIISAIFEPMPGVAAGRSSDVRYYISIAWIYLIQTRSPLDSIRQPLVKALDASLVKTASLSCS